MNKERHAHDRWRTVGLLRAPESSAVLVALSLTIKAGPFQFSVQVRNQLHLNQVPQSHRDNPQAWTSCPDVMRSCRGFTARQASGFRLVPVLSQPLLPQPPLALGLVFVQELRRRQSRLFQLVAWFVVLPGVSLALAGGDDGNFVCSCAAVLALQLDALGAGLVIDTSPVLAVAPTTPELPAVGAANPVLKHLSWETLTGAHQLFDGVDAGAVAIRDILCWPELSTSDLASICGKTMRSVREKDLQTRVSIVTLS